MKPQKNRTIDIFGRFDEVLSNKFTNSLKNISEHEHIICNIKSLGGNMKSWTEMTHLVCSLSDDYKVSFTAQIVHAESAALIFAVNMHNVIGTNKSIGAIHLPVPACNYLTEVTKEKIEVNQKKVAEFFIQRTNLSYIDVLALNNIQLSGAEMLKHGIIKNIVKSF